MQPKLTVLAVRDPAINVYVDSKFQLLQKFYDAYNIEVDFQIIEWDQYYPSLMEVFEGKRKADIVMVAGHFWLRDFVNKGFLAPVNYPNSAEYFQEDILPVIADEMRIDGQTYLYPSFCDGHIICYRKSFVTNALGQQIPQVITTDQYLEILSTCSTHPDFKGISFRGSSSEIFLDALPFMRNRGIEVFDSFGNIHYDVTKMVNALNDYLTLKSYTRKEVSTYGNDEVAKDIKENLVSFGVTWGGQLGVILDDDCIDKEDIEFATFNTAWNVTWSFGVVNLSSQKQMCETFLAYITSQEVDRIVGSYAGSPVRRSTYMLDQSLYPWYPMHLELINTYGKPLPSVYDAGTLLGVFYRRIHQALIQELSIEDASIAIDNDLKSILKGE
ncbi:MAG: extracellular solute-binding protein [Erysipelothrix sp.]|jgi:multiple sugar transport system substrate-binding protein|nr:extracellular solute-binding protein [Erysipelothrix sp.]